MGTCKYVLSEAVAVNPDNKMWFSIRATNEHRGSNTRVSYLKIVEVLFRRNRSAILGKDNEITVRCYFIPVVPFLKIDPIVYICNLLKNLFDFALVRLK